MFNEILMSFLSSLLIILLDIVESSPTQSDTVLTEIRQCISTNDAKPSKALKKIKVARGCDHRDAVCDTKIKASLSSLVSLKTLTVHAIGMRIGLDFGFSPKVDWIKSIVKRKETWTWLQVLFKSILQSANLPIFQSSGKWTFAGGHGGKWSGELCKWELAVGLGSDSHRRVWGLLLGTIWLMRMCQLEMLNMYEHVASCCIICHRLSDYRQLNSIAVVALLQSLDSADIELEDHLWAAQTGDVARSCTSSVKNMLKHAKTSCWDLRCECAIFMIVMILAFTCTYYTCNNLIHFGSFWCNFWRFAIDFVNHV